MHRYSLTLKITVRQQIVVIVVVLKTALIKIQYLYNWLVVWHSGRTSNFPILDLLLMCDNYCG